MGEADPSENVQLIAYADRFGGSLTGLHEILDGPLEGLFAGVHVLLFFTPFDGADASFDPVDHAEVDPRLGSWDDVRDLAGEYAVMVDLIVNHVSANSASSATCSPAATPRHTRGCSWPCPTCTPVVRTRPSWWGSTAHAQACRSRP